MAHYLVTGDGGFIGSHLVDRLLRDSHSVTVIDDFSTGRRTNLDAVTLAYAVEVIDSKVSTCERLNEILHDCAGVFHLAAAVGVDLVIQSPINTIRTNLDETETILDAACRRRIPTLIASTSEVYGKSQKSEF